MKVICTSILALTMLSGCVHRTIVRDRGAIGDGPSSVTIGPKNTSPPSASATVVNPAPAQTPVVATQPAPPPPAPSEAQPPSPGSDMVWVAGSYDWRGTRWEWVPGHWERPAQPSLTWESGRWQAVPGGYQWQPGHWR